MMKLRFLTVTPSLYCEDDENCGSTNLNDGRYDHLQKIFHGSKINSTNWPAPREDKGDREGRQWKRKEIESISEY